MPLPQGGGRMKVKCKICGTLVERESAYKIVKNGKNLYYCSEQEYIEYTNKQEEISRQKSRMYELIEYFIGKTTNTALFKEISIWLTVADYDKICNYLADNKTYLTSAMDKAFSSEYAKIRYFSAIVKNSIGDYKPSKPEPIKTVETEFYETKYQPKRKRKCLADYEDGD